MSDRSWTYKVAVVASALLSCLALAQEPAKLQDGTDRGGFYALLDPVIQKDLGLSEKQLEQIKVIQRELQADMSSTLGGPLPRKGAGIDREKLFAEIAKHTKSANSKCLKVLSKTQRTRFGQIELQLLDGLALARPDVQKKLGLSKSQKSQIAEIMDADSLTSGMAQSMYAMKSKINRKLLAVLSESELKKFNEMKGAPLKLTKGG